MASENVCNVSKCGHVKGSCGCQRRLCVLHGSCVCGHRVHGMSRHVRSAQSDAHILTRNHTVLCAGVWHCVAAALAPCFFGRFAKRFLFRLRWCFLWVPAALPSYSYECRLARCGVQL